jgi:hypothetical protein
MLRQIALTAGASGFLWSSVGFGWGWVGAWAWVDAGERQGLKALTLRVGARRRGMGSGRAAQAAVSGAPSPPPNSHGRRRRRRRRRPGPARTERVPPRQQHVRHHARRPHVGRRPDGRRQRLGRLVPGRALEPQVVARRAGGVEGGREAKVYRLYGGALALIQEHEVSGLGGLGWLVGWLGGWVGGGGF